MFSNPLVRELAVVLAIKLVFISTLWFAFFRAGETQAPAGEETGRALLISGAPEPMRPQP